MGRLNSLYIKSKGFRILLHLAYWALAWSFTNLLFGYGNLGNTFSLIYSSIILLIAAAVSYLTVYFLIPQFLARRKYGLFLASLVFTVIVSLDLELFTTFLFVLLWEKFQVLEFFQSTRDIYTLIAGTYFIVFLSVAIKMFEFWYNEQRKRQEAISEKIQAELKLLKSQIHPHFLFNTLNNIYSLAMQKSDQAPEAVLKLSELLEFLIYHGENEKVPLSKETDLIRNYIELESLRYGDRLDLDFKVSGKPENIQVAPLLLMPLVENAFKHGISKSSNNQQLKIKLEITGKFVEFYVENSRPRKNLLPDSGGGTGLINWKKRLDLMYKGRNSFKINDEDNKYSVFLKLET